MAAADPESGAAVIRASDVTVVVPTIEGREQLLDRALASVARQQTPPGNVVVQLDKDRHGATWCRNQAIEHVTTDWIAWLDDDDELLPNHLKVCVRAANDTKADLIFTYPEFVGGKDPLACVNDLGVLTPEPIHIPFGAAQKTGLRRYGNFIPVTYLVKTALVRQVGGFPEPYTFEAVNSGDCEDYGLLLRLLDVGAKFNHVCGVRTWRYHFHEANLGGRGLDRLHEMPAPP